MRELSVNEIKQVNGGVIPIGVALAIHLAGNAASIYGWYKFAKSMKP
ncbi:class IIb bacteriocin, lactobin A/cerein 7B family [Aestuariibacter halophilus]|uniref:Class IIb bacteriocin, lactobin A/cerein 7B family n=1 Tax=Fluctibacter halophilus TaxID=226011 RepID=A0ABS8GBK3_9ALTE|nr:class IIb bacteriocin, lactobin A/cerein 7B family [Aestuariibacter halophilus]MCC2617957.1 class IIb bacteriocin, lactobin A/cerein 7B family [Aestuariibacter halophilus]